MTSECSTDPRKRLALIGRRRAVAYLEEVEQGRELERRRHDAEDERGADVAARLPLVFLHWGRRHVHSQC